MISLTDGQLSVPHSKVYLVEDLVLFEQRLRGVQCGAVVRILQLRHFVAEPGELFVGFRLPLVESQRVLQVLPADLAGL